MAPDTSFQRHKELLSNGTKRFFPTEHNTSVQRHKTLHSNGAEHFSRHQTLLSNGTKRFFQRHKTLFSNVTKRFFPMAQNAFQLLQTLPFNGTKRLLNGVEHFIPMASNTPFQRLQIGRPSNGPEYFPQMAPNSCTNPRTCDAKCNRQTCT